jgi:CRISPR-associated protein Csm5
MNKQIYKLKLTAISPIHIGTGEDFEPTNYVIDKNKKGEDRLYEFDEFKFFGALDDAQKKEFNSIVSDSSPNSRFRLYKFVSNNKNVAKKIAFRNIQVLKDVADEYYEKIGNVVQKEGGEKNVFNEFKVAKCYTTPNTNTSVILGSSLKGSISTAYQEMLFKKLKDYEKVKDLMLKPSDENLFKKFIVSDANPLKQGTFIGYAINKKRNEETEAEIKTRVQAISATSEFQTEVICKDGLDFKEIIRSCNEHYMPLFKSQFDYSTDEYTRKAISSNFVQKYENWTPTQNQFLLKVGKHSGARAVTVDGIREIKIMTGKGRNPRFGSEETTVWLRGGSGSSLVPFGWLLCEVID